MAGGQPTKYNQEKLDKAVEYMKNYEAYGDAIPSHVGLAVVLGVCERTLYNWADSNQEFLQMLAMIKSAQHNVLLSRGLTNEFNATIVKLVLSKHGYSEKTEQKLSGAVGMVDLSEKSDEELKAIIGDDS